MSFVESVRRNASFIAVLLAIVIVGIALIVATISLLARM